jgi:hypothetical protein
MNYDLLDDLVIDLGVRHVRTPEGAKKYGQPIGSVIKPDAPGVGQVMHAAEAVAKPKTTRVHMDEDTFDEHARAQARAEGLYEKAVVHAPMRSYFGVRTMEDAAFADNPDAAFALRSDDPALGWALYQCQAFHQINPYLREGKDASVQIGPADYKASEIVPPLLKAFDTMGVKTTHPTKWFRVDMGHHWSVKDFHVGDVWTDKGVISTTPDPDEIVNFLAYAPQEADEVPEHPFLMEIHAPTGQRVLGGYVGGIETMLPPGTKFRTVSVGETKLGPNHIPLVTLEVIE